MPFNCNECAHLRCDEYNQCWCSKDYGPEDEDEEKNCECPFFKGYWVDQYEPDYYWRES